MLKPPMEIAQHISVDPSVHQGTPVITGTRVPISIIIGSLAGGMSKEEVMQEYELSQKQVEAALSYATELVKQTEVIVLGA
ncbi:MAG: DUF433 domain-containing protein [Scytonema sp. PMC 1069.18]|nr:DUF433 domain-containing protein [Scytonema sp. PMC 1069.18]MEC4884868.1 DUF433 domain-containing protein [Scytonema sp. PMC 1070.18]